MAKNLYNTEAGKDKVLRRFSMFDNAGIDISSASSYEDALSMCGLNYTAEKKPIYLGNGIEIADKYAAVKSDNENHVLGVVGKDYCPVSNYEAFGVAEELVNEGVANYEVGGPSLKMHDMVDYSRSFMVLKGDDFDIDGDDYNSFIVFNNSFDGTTGVQYRIVCQRLVCLNGLTRYLGGKKNQLTIKIQHSRQASDKIKEANDIVINYNNELKALKKEAEMFMNVKFTKEQFVSEIIPMVLAEKKIVTERTDEKKISKATFEKADMVVSQLMQAYNADDVQNYVNSAYRVILALTDYETHSAPLRDTGNGHVYMNRVLQGMLLTSTVAQYIAKKYNLPVNVR